MVIRGGIDLVEDLARKIKAVAFDVDGVVTDNTFFEKKVKTRSYYDGQGVSLLRAIGIKVAFVTNTKGESAQMIESAVSQWNNLPSSRKPGNENGWEHIALFLGFSGEGKVRAIEDWLIKNQLTWDLCAAMGDDLVDIPLLKRAVLRAAPVTAEEVVKSICHFVSDRPGGYGALRDFVNFILKIRGIDPTTLPPH